MIKNFIKMIAIISAVLVLGTLNTYSSENDNTILRSPSTFVKSLRNADLNDLLSRLEGIIIIRRPNTEYSKMSPKELEQYISDKIRSIDGIRIIDDSRSIEIIKPIQKTPVKRDYKVGGIKENINAAVNDPGYKYEWDISYTEADKAWALIKQKRQVNVAVLDTGVDYTHPDLKNKVLKDKGYNFVNNNRDTMDNNGHGTHVAGIIAAEANNGIGVSGITGTLDVKIIPVKVLDEDGEGGASNIVKGIIYAADNGADIINLSIGTNSKVKAIADAINYAKSKGVFVVAAAGNSGQSSDNVSPASDGAFTVAAMNYNYKTAYFSDYGNSVKVAAPGVEILSTVPGGYEAWDGTSMSAPIVSGIAAMVKAENPNLSPSQIENVLSSTSKDIMYTGKDQLSGYGLIDAYNAIKKVKETEK